MNTIRGFTMDGNTDNETFKIKKVTMWQIFSGILGLLLIISIFTNGFRFGNSTGGTVIDVQNNNDDDIPTNEDNVAVKADIKIGDDPVIGNKDAKVTIIEFSDYQCPFCQRFFEQTLPQIDQEYIKTGKVKLVYKDFPLNAIHPQAQKAAESANCALEQNKYWEYHDALFRRGSEWSGNDKAVDVFKSIAKDLKLDTKKFDSCLDTSKYAAEISKDTAEGSAAGVTGTPAFFINGQLVSGAQPFTNFKTIIDAELAQ